MPIAIRTAWAFDLPRISEIKDCVVKCGHAGHYFEKFDITKIDNTIKRKHFLHLEAELAELDFAAWEQIKTQIIPLFQKGHSFRGWQAAFDKLNEAKALATSRDSAVHS